MLRRSCREHRVPDYGRGLACHAEPTEIELALSDAMQKLDAGDRHGRTIEELEAEHGLYARFHATVVLLDHVVQVL